VLVIALLGLLKSCGDARELSKMRKEVAAIKDSTYTKQELEIKLQIEGLKTSKRTLYDWNTVIRTTQRPDDIMINYDNQINKLEKTIK
jgi:hypothetical protein